MAKLNVNNLHVQYGKTQVLKGVSIDVQDGEIIALLGRSGCGKSTLLRAIAGLEIPTGGSITIGDKTVFDSASKTNIAPEKRDLGLVFQSYALWPHKTVMDNVAYGLKVRGKNKADIKASAEEVLEGVGLAQYGHRFPSELSGGQQQRVALARALAYRPPLILLDEPLSNLDAKLREEARVWIRQLIKKSGLAAIFVTHDQVEAMAIADRVMLMNEGLLVQEGSPEQLYTNPKTLFAADFMGVNNTINAKVAEVNGKFARLDIDGETVWGINRGNRQVGDDATSIIRIEDVGIDQPEGVEAHLDFSAYLGGRWEHVFNLNGRSVRAVSTHTLDPGNHRISLPQTSLWVF
ncbi:MULTISPECIES: ABC transporter ATP-binding protein [unclassified Brevundimonas]|uniref:ABC transporter ATP-binding protein n=1 Tax=unclassified Brevundimonas TaxID=2622653 RepID=UPI0025C61ED5|nr:MULTISPECIES: ABC transporter ATP-binding protein [unclassified Brevundimonas]